MQATAKLSVALVCVLIVCALVSGCGASSGRAAPLAQSTATVGRGTTESISLSPTRDPAARRPSDLSSAQIAPHVLALARLAREIVRNDAGSGPGEKTLGLYWKDGVFGSNQDSQPCWYCYADPATTAGILSETRLSQPILREIGVQTWTRAINTMLQSNGAVKDGNASVAVATGMFAVNIGLSYLELEPYLSPAVRTLWSSALERMANYLIASGNTTFYVNGNVNLRQTEVMWLTWAVTHDRAYYNDYQSEYAFTISPPTPRWTGYGLQISTQPTEHLDANGAGYLTESNGAGAAPGFDPYYTSLQLDTATQLYVLTHNDRYLTLMNLEFNQLRPYVTGNYLLNAHGGTRKNEEVPFLSAAPLVLLLSRDRPDLANFWLGELAEIHQQYIESETFVSVGFSNSLTPAIGTAMLAIQYPQGILAKPCSPDQAPCSALF